MLAMFFWRFMRDRLGNFLSESDCGSPGEVPGRGPPGDPAGTGEVPAPYQPPGGRLGPKAALGCVFEGEMAREGSVC